MFTGKNQVIASAECRWETRIDPNGYEEVATRFMEVRSNSIGVARVREWAGAFPTGTPILDLGCGHGVPISQVLLARGLVLYGVDASTTMTTAFQQRFPRARVACEAVEDSSFFNRTFDGVVAVGLMFLLSADVQLALIRKVAGALNAGGRLLFTSPEPACTWVDTLTGRPSLSLGAADYGAALSDAGLALVGEYDDEGNNHYFDAHKSPDAL